MRFYSLVFFLITTLFSAASQPKIKLDAKLTNSEKFGEKLNAGWGKLVRDGVAIDSVFSSNGRVFFKLDTGHVYSAFFWKDGFVSKFLMIDTRNVPQNYRSHSTIKVEVMLFPKNEALDVSFLSKQPMGIAVYNDIKKTIDWESEYSRLVTDKIIQATLDYVSKKNESLNKQGKCQGRIVGDCTLDFLSKSKSKNTG